MQVIGNDEPKYVPRKFKMIPAKLREQGYKTHMLGKYVENEFLYLIQKRHA